MPPKFIEYKKSIDEFLLKFLSSGLSRFTSVNSWGRDVSRILSPFVINGKTIRGGLVLFANECYGGTVCDDALRVASAMELVHSGLLIHDDIIDADRERRGLKTVYAQYEEKAKSLMIADPLRFGQGMAICMGDITFFLATQLISELQNVEVSQEILAILSKEYQRVCFAQMQDVAFGFTKTIPTYEDIHAVYKYKTARYTFSLPLMVGATLTGAKPEAISLFEKLGEQMGIIFQIQDDLLNLYGDPNVTGKPVGSDLREDKKTLAYAYIHEHMSIEEKKKLQQLTESKNETDAKVAYLYELLEKYKVREFLNGETGSLYNEAMESISSLSIDTNQKKIFIDLIEFTKTRKK